MITTTTPKKLFTAPLILASNEQKIKIGKIVDNIAHERCLVTKDPNSKVLSLIEKRKGKPEAKYTGTQFSEQTSKYFLIKFNSQTNSFEAYPADDWRTFKRDIHYKTLTEEEAEEKMKSKTGYMDYFKNKVVPTAKKQKGAASEEKTEGGKAPRVKIFAEEEEEPLEDAQRPFEKEKEEEKEESDPDLKEISSDLEDYVSTKKEKTIIEKAIANNQVEEEEESESDDDIFASGEEESESKMDDEGSSDFDEDFFEQLPVVDKPAASTHEFLGNKRKGDEINSSGSYSGEKMKKQRSAAVQMEETLNNLFSKNKQMTYEKISKELMKEYSTSDIEAYLKQILDRVAKQFQQKGEYYYFKKSD